MRCHLIILRNSKTNNLNYDVVYSVNVPNKTNSEILDNVFSILNEVEDASNLIKIINRSSNEELISEKLASELLIKRNSLHEKKFTDISEIESIEGLGSTQWCSIQDRLLMQYALRSSGYVFPDTPFYVIDNLLDFINQAISIDEFHTILKIPYDDVATKIGEEIFSYKARFGDFLSLEELAFLPTMREDVLKLMLTASHNVIIPSATQPTFYSIPPIYAPIFEWGNMAENIEKMILFRVINQKWQNLTEFTKWYQWKIDSYYKEYKRLEGVVRHYERRKRKSENELNLEKSKSPQNPTKIRDLEKQLDYLDEKLNEKNRDLSEHNRKIRKLNAANIEGDEKTVFAILKHNVFEHIQETMEGARRNNTRSEKIRDDPKLQSELKKKAEKERGKAIKDLSDLNKAGAEIGIPLDGYEIPSTDF